MKKDVEKKKNRHWRRQYKEVLAFLCSITAHQMAEITVRLETSNI